MTEEKSQRYSSMPKIGQETVLMAPQDFMYVYTRKNNVAPRTASPKTKHSEDKILNSPLEKTHAHNSKGSLRSQRTNPVFVKSSNKPDSKSKTRGIYKKLFQKYHEVKKKPNKLSQSKGKLSERKLTLPDKDEEDPKESKPSCCWCRYGCWFCMCACGYPPENETD